MLPVRRQKHIVVEELPRETLVYDKDRQIFHCLNEAASLVWQHCDGKTTLDKLAGIMNKAGVPKSEEVVRFALAELAERHLLLDPREYLTKEAARLSRRDFARKLGVAAVLVPAVMTIIAPTAATAASACTPGGVQPGGQRCNTANNFMCCSGLCQGSNCAFPPNP